MIGLGMLLKKNNDYYLGEFNLREPKGIGCFFGRDFRIV